jgi:phage FluMu protein Com
MEKVRCLECGEVYVKPVAGGTVERNPGCPRCEYVGWVPVMTRLGGTELRRSVADRRPLRVARPR